MKSNQTVQFAGYERLLAALAKVPPERMKVVDERASIFVSGMEAMARFQSPAPEPSGKHPRTAAGT